MMGKYTHKVGLSLLINNNTDNIHARIEEAKKDCARYIARTLIETDTIEFREKRQANGDVVVEASLLICNERTLDEINMARYNILECSKKPIDREDLKNK